MCPKCISVGSQVNFVCCFFLLRYGFLEFESEKTTEKNHSALQGKTVDGKPVVVDFCGAKSTSKKQSKPQKEMPGL